ncbi:hypothetical protein GOODEAATRI_001717 [Goodea atripinnis]|uniref:Uncharacterized protein n=1 Tax=Goodea atripinnis TaxID=208336 RepID=A0ABV0PAK8_9TELE
MAAQVNCFRSTLDKNPTTKVNVSVRNNRSVMKGGRRARRQSNIKDFSEKSGWTLDRGADMSETESSKRGHAEEVASCSDKQLFFDHDYATNVVQKRKEYMCIKKILKERGIRFQTHLTRIRIHWESGIRIYESPQAAVEELRPGAGGGDDEEHYPGSGGKRGRNKSRRFKP